MKKIPLVAVVGPTAAGKTAFSAALAAGEGGEIVSADSMQIYRELSVSTAKPTREEMRGVPHHMMDMLSVSEPYSVAQYASDARSVIADIAARGHLPFLVGGTGLYLDAVLQNLQFSEQSTSPALRTQLEVMWEQEGGAAMLLRLVACDPDIAASLHANDRKRILRALEVREATGVPLSEWNRRSRAEAPPYQTLKFGLTFRDRATLYARIDARVDRMVQQGIVEEARALFAGDVCQTAAQAIGCKEFLPYLTDGQSLDACVETLKRQTRRYAKRQLTWFRRDQEIHWFYLDEQPMESALETAHQMIHETFGREGNADE